MFFSITSGTRCGDDIGIEYMILGAEIVTSEVRLSLIFPIAILTRMSYVFGVVLKVWTRGTSTAIIYAIGTNNNSYWVWLRGLFRRLSYYALSSGGG